VAHPDDAFEKMHGGLLPFSKSKIDAMRLPILKTLILKEINSPETDGCHHPNLYLENSSHY
jgi:hypothetical protein